ncbi:TPR Domain containing protein [Trichomonas vaginalis G3]|uniref:Tetratricopeptide repeat protein 29 n=1 Tax=Trichomonas vaginalis (strain ATCC PRA-98 / G3) TaxID=412133 RepID=A2FM14_TRIV3|nr:tetratricopeptide repeat-containing protein [Trichomonas vaginalis G3]EAX94055.1 TPR Domain containing protein [Trichomonas vaginalis G3]KAI5548215.1 tetratricopeptide repeat-containing protein [Trichomonas vaginalis G3]|eukprot:XP_001306985.1 TPR Domain containing protein [Trichomonas vaginalis G3]
MSDSQPQMTEEERKQAIAYKNLIIERNTGDAQKRARKKEPSLAVIKKRTMELTTQTQTLERTKVELKKPTDADLFSKEECICIELLTSGYVDSFSDFFKITHPKAPGSYHYDYWQSIDSGEVTSPPPPVVPTNKYDFIQERLIQAENARRIAKDAELATAYTDLSQYFQSINDMKIAIIYLEKLRDYALFTSDLIREAQALKEIGRLFKEAGNLESSLHFCEECLSVCVSINDGVAEAQAALIDAYRKYSQSLIARGEGKQAIEFLNKSLRVASESGVLLSLAICHQELGLCYKQLEMLDSAIEHFEKAFSIYKGLGNIEGQSSAVSALATSYKYMEKIDEAIKYFKILHELANQTGNAHDKAMSCFTMGKILWESGQKEEALVWFQKNFDISLELNDLAVIEDSRISLGVSLANYRMQRFEELVRNNQELPALLNWMITRDDEPFQSIKSKKPE